MDSLTEKQDSFNNFIGNKSAVILAKAWVDSAKKDDVLIPHMLFTGAAGCGKTNMAISLAQYANAKYLPVIGVSIETENDLFNIIRKASFHYETSQRYVIVIMDEAHAIKKRIQDALLTFLSEGYLSAKQKGVKENYEFERAESGKQDFISLFFATTNASKLTEAMRSRLRLISLDRYSKNEISQIVAQTWTRLELGFTAETTQYLANLCFSPRNAINLGTDVYDMINANTQATNLGMGLLQSTLKILGFDENGLSVTDREILRTLARSGGGTLSIGALGRHLHLDPKELMELAEPKLLELSLIEIVSGGRKITPEGRGTIGEIKKRITV